MSKENKRYETVYVGSMELLQELAKKKVLPYFKTVKFKDSYPLFGFIGVPKVLKIVNSFAEEHNGNIDYTVDDVSMWKDHSEFITQDLKGVSKSITRNIHILKTIILSGYAYRINKVFVDKSGKRVYSFYTCPEIDNIKSEGDKISHEKWEKRQQKKTNSDAVNNDMKMLIEKAISEVENATE